MNARQRAWRYITRGLAKTILLSITFFVIGNLVILGLGISQAANNAKIMTRKQMRAAISYEVDYDSYYNWINTLTDQDEIDQAYSSYPKIDQATAVALSQDSRVKAFNYFISQIGYSKSFENVPVGNEETRNSGYTIDGSTYVEPNITIRGNATENTIEIAEGTYTLVSGRFYDQNDIDEARKVVMITKELAEQNGLAVGDSLTFTLMDSYTLEELKNNGISVNEDDTNLELEIIGIYDTPENVDPNAENFQWMSAYESPKNVLLMPMSALVDYLRVIQTYQFEMYKQYYDENTTVDTLMENVSQPSKVVYLLNDPLEVNDFVEDHTNDIGNYMKLDANNDTFKKLARPLDTMSFFANIVVWIVVVNAIIIITLVTALTMKSREYEIGVLLSLGVSKLATIGQLFMELFMIALLGFTLAVGSGSLLAGRVGKTVLEYQTNTEQQYETGNENTYVTYWGNDDNYFTTVTQEDLYSKYEVKVSPLLIGEIYLLGTVVVLIATLIPGIMIMRLNPKQILLEKN